MKPARDHFARVVELSPRSELASLGLFHSLWQLKQYRAARAELVRYLTTYESDECEQLMVEMGWRFDRAKRRLVRR
jgi:Tfp pilus assembly protein PilF